MSEKLYTVAEVAEMFGVTSQTVRNWAERFPNRIEGGDRRTVMLIPASDVEVVKKEEADKLLEQLTRLGFQTVPA